MNPMLLIPEKYNGYHVNRTNCKFLEVTESLTSPFPSFFVRQAYILESKGLLSPYQSGFRKGRNTMDSILCLESEIRKAQTKKKW